jgi:hypothetical protein
VSGHPVQEEDRIPVGKIVLVAVVSLAVFAIGVVWSVSIQRSENQTIVQWHKSIGPDKIGEPEVGIVYQLPFNKSAYAEDKKAEKQLWLSHYGWTDKAKGTVHTPIDVAIQKYVSQAGAGAVK